MVAGAFFANGQPANTQTLQYFSFTTLTTLGYGDFTAAGSLGRAVAVLEALTGQVFLATLVARLVSAYGTAIAGAAAVRRLTAGRARAGGGLAASGDAAQQFVDGALDETGGGRGWSRACRGPSPRR